MKRSGRRSITPTMPPLRVGAQERFPTLPGRAHRYGLTVATGRGLRGSATAVTSRSSRCRSRRAPTRSCDGVLRSALRWPRSPLGPNVAQQQSTAVASGQQRFPAKALTCGNRRTASSAIVLSKLALGRAAAVFGRNTLDNNGKPRPSNRHPSRHPQPSIQARATARRPSHEQIT